MISQEILQNFLVSYIYIHYVLRTDKRTWWLNQQQKDTWSKPYLMSCDVLYYIKEGKFKLTVNGQVYHPKAGQMLYLPANIEFELQILSENPLVFYYVHADLGIGSNKINEIFDFPYVCTAADPQKTERLFEQLMQRFNAEGSIAALEANAVFLQLVCHFLKESKATPILQMKQASDLQRIVEYIHANLRHNFTVGELARLANYSPAHFSRKFKKLFGRLPLEYITNVKMKYAKKRLQKTELSVAEIAEELGYGDVGHFSALFKKQIGVTPATYRKNKMWKI